MGKWGEKQGLKIGDAYLGEGYYRVKWYSCLFNEQCVIGGLSNPLITYSGAYPFTFRQPIKHKIAFKSTILYPFIP